MRGSADPDRGETPRLDPGPRSPTPIETVISSHRSHAAHFRTRSALRVLFGHRGWRYGRSLQGT